MRALIPIPDVAHKNARTGSNLDPDRAGFV